MSYDLMLNKFGSSVPLKHLSKRTVEEHCKAGRFMLKVHLWHQMI